MGFRTNFFTMTSNGFSVSSPYVIPPGFSPSFQPSQHLAPEPPRILQQQQQQQQQPKNLQVFNSHLRGI
jgi:hypothetical protein